MTKSIATKWGASPAVILGLAVLGGALLACGDADSSQVGERPRDAGSDAGLEDAGVEDAGDAGTPPDASNDARTGVGTPGETDASCGNGEREGPEACDDGNEITDACNYGERECEVCDRRCRFAPGKTAFCGDGRVDEEHESCDDGNAVEGDGCDSDCSASACGNAITGGEEACDDGNAVEGDGCDSNCSASACGNGVPTAGEICDDGNLLSDDGCDANCTPTGCGNGVVTTGEICDDGDLESGDGCDANCTPTGCGNGVVTTGETCDDGNAVEGDSCDSNCTVPACGNGIVAPNEACDDGDLESGDGCDGNCTVTACGNGITTAGEACDDANGRDGDGCDGNCTVTACGNGVTTAGEACDDGNGISGDGCDVNCTPTACNNGVVTAGEQCDMGPGDAVPPRLGCDEACQVVPGFECTGSPSICVAECGDGIPAAGAEACDDGDDEEGDGCDSNCTVTACGNGITTVGEACDDGNRVNADGCDNNCTLTACGNGIRAGGEECDDGNQADGDACSAACVRICPTDLDAFGAAKDPSTGHCYLSYEDSVNYRVAAAACHALDGYLAVPTSAQESALLRNIQPAADEWTYIGIHDLAYERGVNGSAFQTLTREAIDFQGWSLGEPNDLEDEDCGHLWARGEWNDTDCASAVSYVCELDFGENSRCGDGSRQGAESCDDGDLVNGDGCNANCDAE